jgi:cAMP-dependent protein kinase regulator
MEGYELALYAQFLARVPMFSTCSSEVIRHLAERAETRTVEAGTDVVREGDAGDAFYVVGDGEVVVTKRGTEVARLGRGSYFGELSLLDPAPRSATVTAASTVTVVGLHRDAFRATLDEIPTVRDALLTGMARRLHEVDGTA